jgi:hypothetical protein
MKKENLKPVKVFSDPDFENRTKNELEAAKKGLQVYLDQWLALGLGPCNDIFGLIMQPRISYDKAVDSMIGTPASQGPFKVNKNKYRDQLELPDPALLLKARNNALKNIYSTKSDLWSVENDRIVMNQQEAEAIIDSQSVYCTKPEKIKLAEDLLAAVDLWNSLNVRLGGELFDSANPHVNAVILGKFSFVAEDQRGHGGKLVILPDYMRKILQ